MVIIDSGLLMWAILYICRCYSVQLDIYNSCKSMIPQQIQQLKRGWSHKKWTQFQAGEIRKEKIWKSKKFVHKSSSNRWFRNGIHSLLSLADARGSADIIYGMWRISILCYWRQKIGRSEYLIPTNNITVLDHFFNLTINLISSADFNTI